MLTWDLGTTTWIAQAAPSGSGIPATLLDAKGDLIVASAADTAARLAVGSNTYVLTADSGETLGVKWAAASAVGGGSAYPLDAAPGSAHAADDEFDDTSGMSGSVNGLDAQWTSPVTSATGQGITVTWPATGWMTFEPTTSGTSSTGKRTFGMRQTSPTGSFTVSAKVVDDGAE